MKLLRYVAPLAPLDEREQKILDGINYFWDVDSDGISDMRVTLIEDLVDDLVAIGVPLRRITGRRISDRLDELSVKKLG